MKSHPYVLSLFDFFLNAAVYFLFDFLLSLLSGLKDVGGFPIGSVSLSFAMAEARPPTAA